MGGIGSGPIKSQAAAKKGQMRLALPDGYPKEIDGNFRWLVGKLATHGIAHVDVYAIADMAFYLWQKTEAMKLLAAEGIVVTDNAHGGEPRKHPALTIYRQADMQFQRLAVQFGMTPVSRARLLPPEPDVNDEYEAFRDAK